MSYKEMSQKDFTTRPANRPATGDPSRGPCATPLSMAVPLMLRIALGGLMMLSGYMKLGGPALNLFGAAILPLGPLDFSFSIDKFALGLPEQLTLLLAHIVPWAEFLAGALLVLGLLTRGAALLVCLLMIAFGAGIASLMARGMNDVRCPCFGSLGLFCGQRPMGICHLIRNTGFFLAAATLVRLGYGGLGLDGLFSRLRVRHR